MGRYKVDDPIYSVPQLGPRCPVATPGIALRLWDTEGFNANSTPWLNSIPVRLDPATGATTTTALLPGVIAGDALYLFVTIKSLAAITAPTVTDSKSNTWSSVVVSTGKYQTYMFKAENAASGDTTVTLHNTSTIAGHGFALDVTGVPTSGTVDVSSAATSGYLTNVPGSPTVAGALTTTATNELVLAYVYNAMGVFGAQFSIGGVNSRTHAVITSGEGALLSSGRALAAGAIAPTMTFPMGGDSITLITAGIKAGTIASSPNVVSQQCLLPSRHKYPNFFSVQLVFSADPGTFAIDVQTADTDVDADYISRATINSGLNTSFIGRAEFTGVVGKFVRLKLVTLTNAVRVTADLFA